MFLDHEPNQPRSVTERSMYGDEGPVQASCEFAGLARRPASGANPEAMRGIVQNILKGMLHGVMLEFANNKDDAASATMLEDFITRAGLREAATMPDVKVNQDPEDRSWHIAQILYVLHKQGIPFHVFGSPDHRDTRETLKKCLGEAPPGKVVLVMIGPKHFYSPETASAAGPADDIPDSAFGLLNQQARNEYGVNIAGFNGCWSSNVYKYGSGPMKGVIYVNQSRSRSAIRQDKFYKKVLFPNIRDMSDKGEPFENIRRFRDRICP